MHVQGNETLRCIIDQLDAETEINSPNHPTSMMVTASSADNNATEETTKIFLLDSGAEFHMVNKINLLHNAKEMPHQIRNCADCTAKLVATHLGNLWAEVQALDSVELNQIELKMYYTYLCCPAI